MPIERAKVLRAPAPPLSSFDKSHGRHLEREKKIQGNGRRCNNDCFCVREEISKVTWRLKHKKRRLRSELKIRVHLSLVLLSWITILFPLLIYSRCTCGYSRYHFCWKGIRKMCLLIARRFVLNWQLLQSRAISWQKNCFLLGSFNQPICCDGVTRYTIGRNDTRLIVQQSTEFEIVYSKMIHHVRKCAVVVDGFPNKMVWLIGPDSGPNELRPEPRFFNLNLI